MANHFMDFFTNHVELSPDAVFQNFKLQKDTLYKNVCTVFANTVLQRSLPFSAILAYNTSAEKAAKQFLRNSIEKSYFKARIGDTFSALSEFYKLNSGDLAVFVLAESLDDYLYFCVESLNDQCRIGIIDKAKVSGRRDIIINLLDYLKLHGYKAEPLLALPDTITL
ncbi:hypothetical protein AMJ80_11780 [bacterium SM23_31]|nr:MAG: hypothetical protein AMJ80_11780 [bacterium SM23_31]